MRYTHLLCALAIAVAGAGCGGNWSSPEGVILTVAKALKKNDTEVYTVSLKGEAKEKYGTLRGMMQLQELLHGKKLKLSKPERQNVARPRPPQCDLMNIYSVRVNEKSHGLLMTVETECCTTKADNKGAEPGEKGFEEDMTACLISKIDLLPQN